MNTRYEDIKDIIEHSVKEWQKELKSAVADRVELLSYKDDAKHVLRLNVDVNRELPLFDFFADLAVAFELYDRYPLGKVLSGIVFSGKEHSLQSKCNLQAQLKIIQFFMDRESGTCKPKPPLSIHAGEVDGAMMTHMKDRVQEVIDFKPARLGHMAALSCLKDVIQTLKEQDICVEMCLTSNEKLFGITNGISPFLILLREGAPVTLNTDDPGILLTDLHHEFLIATKRYHLNYEDIKTLARNQIIYGFIPEAANNSKETESYEDVECYEVSEPASHDSESDDDVYIPSESDDDVSSEDEISSEEYDSDSDDQQSDDDERENNLPRVKSGSNEIFTIQADQHIDPEMDKNNKPSEKVESEEESMEEVGGFESHILPKTSKYNIFEKNEVGRWVLKSIFKGCQEPNWQNRKDNDKLAMKLYENSSKIQMQVRLEQQFYLFEKLKVSKLMNTFYDLYYSSSKKI